jgi:hypothetical protein
MLDRNDLKFLLAVATWLRQIAPGAHVAARHDALRPIITG